MFRREGLGWSLSYLAERAYVSKAYISDLENGKGGRPNIQYLYQLATALDTTIDSLIAGRRLENHPGAAPVVGSDPLPPGLSEFAKGRGLQPVEVEMLARLNFRGSRPRDRDAWAAIYEVIRLASQREK
jgi:transcriptional regulator with XRE-family HTH domain